MAKVSTRDLFDWRRHADGQRYIPAPGGRAATKRKLRGKSLRSLVTVHRTGGTGAKSFEACVEIGGGRIGSHTAKRASGYTTSCMHGSNPRAALASALARASRQMKKRSGAFAGLAGLHRRKRRRR